MALTFYARSREVKPMKKTNLSGVIFFILFISLFPAGPVLLAAGWTLEGWNDLGMHCMDADYSVFSILPPYNNIHAPAD